MAKPIGGGCRERDARIAARERRVADLKARLGQNSSNSSLPSSANLPAAPNPAMPLAGASACPRPWLTSSAAADFRSDGLLAPLTLSKYLSFPEGAHDEEKDHPKHARASDDPAPDARQRPGCCRRDHGCADLSAGS